MRTEFANRRGVIESNETGGRSGNGDAVLPTTSHGVRPARQEERAAYGTNKCRRLCTARATAKKSFRITFLTSDRHTQYGGDASQIGGSCRGSVPRLCPGEARYIARSLLASKFFAGPELKGRFITRSSARCASPSTGREVSDADPIRRRPHSPNETTARFVAVNHLTEDPGIIASRKVALVVPDLEGGGGVPAVAWFLFNVLRASGRYRPEIISPATSAKDPFSIRVLSPRSWTRGIRVGIRGWNGENYTHIGASLAEFEFQRYQPRKALTDLLNEYDIVQVVSGSPAWALVARDTAQPVLLQVATLAKVERRRMLSEGAGALWLWRRLMTSITARLDEKALRHVDVAIVENRWMFDHLRGLMGDSRVRYAPPGVDVQVFRPRAGTEECGALRTPYILSVGRFADPRKNLPLLFRAYARLRQAETAAPRLVLAGKSMPSADDWAVARELGIAEHVEQRQNVSLEEVAMLHRCADLFVSSSDEEGLGLAILEAMASGIPVVSTRSGGPDEVIADNETGYLVPLGDEAALADRMLKLIQDRKHARRMGERGRDVAVQRYSLAAAGNAFLRIYDSIHRCSQHEDQPDSPSAVVNTEGPPGF